MAGATWVSPIHSFSEPTVVPEIASSRVIPDVCAVEPDSVPAMICTSGLCHTALASAATTWVTRPTSS